MKQTIKTQTIKLIEIRREEFIFHYNDGDNIITSLKEAGEELKKFGGVSIPVITDYDEERDNYRFILTKIQRIAKDAGYISYVDIHTEFSGYNDSGFYYDIISGYIEKEVDQ